MLYIMRDSPRIRRLNSDLKSLQQLATDSSIFDFTPYGTPPDFYTFRFHGPGCHKPDPRGDVLLREEHEVHIRLRANYPRTMPDFAHQMIKAHLRTSDRLRTVLADLRNAPPLPKHLDGRRQRMIDELLKAKEGDFDGRYLSQQVDAHNEALILLRRYSHSGDVRVAKLFADETALAVRMHLSIAQQLLSDHDRRS